MLHFHAQFGITNMVLILSNFFFHIQPFTNINKYIKPTDSPRTPITHTPRDWWRREWRVSHTLPPNL